MIDANGIAIKACALAGFCVAFYALHVEMSLEKDPAGYEPSCDLRPYVRCSPAFASSFAKGFGFVGYLAGKDSVFNVPNGLTGMIFYAVSFLLSCSDDGRVVNAHYYLTMASNLLTPYLAFVLTFVVRELCPVCLTTYAINAVSMRCLSRKRRQIKSKTN